MISAAKHSVNEADVRCRIDIPETSAEECHSDSPSPPAAYRQQQAASPVAPKGGFMVAGRHLVVTVRRACARKSKQLRWQDAANVGLAVAVTALLLFFPLAKYKGWLRVEYRWGFHCGDPDLMEERPAAGDTVSNTNLMVGSVLVPILMILGNELAIRRTTHGVISLTCSSAKAVLAPSGVFTLAVWYTYLLTDALKSLMAMPRPHFFQTCQPAFDEDLCALKRRITEYMCASDHSEAEKFDSQQSFPSGHASISASAATALIVYTLAKVLPVWARKRSASDMDDVLPCWRKMAPGLLITASVVWAAICGLSRVRDNRHHWWDVLAGSALGVITALLTIWAAPNDSFSCEKTRIDCSNDTLKANNAKNKTMLQQPSMNSMPDTALSRMTPRGSEDHAGHDSGLESVMMHEGSHHGTSSGRKRPTKYDFKEKSAEEAEPLASSNGSEEARDQHQ